MKKKPLLITIVCTLCISIFIFYSCSKQASEKVRAVNNSAAVAVSDTCSCGKTFTGSFSGNGYQFTDKNLVLSCAVANSQVKVACSYSDVHVPTRFTVYDKNHSVAATTTWMGIANCFGPWGSSLNNPITSQTITFNYNTSLAPYKLTVETSIITGCTNSSESWTAKITCTHILP